MEMIKATAANRKVLRGHAKEALKDYSPVMTWLVLEEDGNLFEIVEPQGQTFYTGNDEVVPSTGAFHKAHGEGAARNEDAKK